MYKQTFDDGIKITPFNLREELEDGYFDVDGNYFEKSDPNSFQDNWLQSVDWNKVRILIVHPLPLFMC